MATTGKPYSIPGNVDPVEYSNIPTTTTPPYILTTTGDSTAIPFPSNTWTIGPEIKSRKKEGRYSELSSEYRWLDPKDSEDQISDFPTDFSRLVDIIEDHVKLAFPLNGIPGDIEMQFAELKEKLAAAERELDDFVKNVSEYFLVFQRLRE